MSEKKDKKNDELSVIQISDLITGTVIETPLYDDKMTLLLAKGSTITKENKQALINRGISEVMGNASELGMATNVENQNSATNASVSFDTETTNKIDQIIESGLLQVKNEGDPFKKKMKSYGKKVYDTDQSLRLDKSHATNEEMLEDVMSSVEETGEVDGFVMTSIASGYLNEMEVDSENVLTSIQSQFRKYKPSTQAIECCLLAMALGIEMDLDEENVRILGIAGLIHDVGMLKVPKEIREATHRLSAIEMLEIHKHPIYSLELLQKDPSLPNIIPLIAYQVHERLNGTGYPRQRRGQTIHKLARIVQVADEYVSMTSPVNGQLPVMRYSAMECLIKKSKKKDVDPDVVRSLLNALSLFPIGSYVSLNDESTAKVIRSNRESYIKPIVMRVSDAQENASDATDESNLIDLMTDEEFSIAKVKPTPGREEIKWNELEN